MRPSIEEAVSKRGMKEFVGLPDRLYRGDRNRVPPLRIAERELFDRKRHPFHEHADVAFLLARNGGGEAVGRVAAFVNHIHNEYHGEKTGFFGFLEGEDDPQVFGALLDAACEWAAARGMDRMRGPFNYSTNEDCGMLVKGFDSPPLIMMPYNPPWYPGLVEGAGFLGIRDLLAYWTDSDLNDYSRLGRIAAAVRSREDVRLRTFRMGDYFDEVSTVMNIYNECWKENWGFVPTTGREFEHTGRELRSVLVSDLAPIIECGSGPVAFAIAVPDANQAIAAGRGRLLPTLLALKVPPFRVRIDRVRVLLLGVRKAYRGRGLEAVLIDHIVRESRALGMGRGELSWVLADNTPMRRILENVIEADQYKTYRIYQKEFGG
jgi:GNAT superfamily N-acetyltransferase